LATAQCEEELAKCIFSFSLFFLYSDLMYFSSEQIFQTSNVEMESNRGFAT